MTDVTIINAPTTPVSPTNSTITNSDPNARTQYDSMKLLAIFVLIVFFVLGLFILIYYYFVKRLKSDQVTRVPMKSTSGSITDEKARNIFAHPERHLAVDQSRRSSPPAESTPASSATSAAETSGSLQPSSMAADPAGQQAADPSASKMFQRPQQVQQTQQQQQQSTPPPSTPPQTQLRRFQVPQQQRQASPTKGKLLKQQIMEATRSPAAKGGTEFQAKQIAEAVDSKGTKTKSGSGSKGRDMTVTGTLANLRDTLKETFHRT